MPIPATAGRGVLEAAFALLEAVEAAEAAGVTRLAAACGLPKTTAHRLLEQLAGLGVVERCRDGGYRIGSRMFQLGSGWQPYPGLRAAAREPMRRLAAATGATVSVSVLRAGRELTVDWLPGPGGSPVALRRGATWPWYTAAGKLLVAGARPAADHAGCPANPGSAPISTPESASLPAAFPTSLPASWSREAELIRSRGVAFDREDVVPGVCCAAVPLYGSPGAPVAALSVITDPSHRLDRLADAARGVAAAVSAALKHPQTRISTVPA